MSKTIAIWGSPNSGKTTFATKLAQTIYEKYQATVILLYADNETPKVSMITILIRTKSRKMFSKSSMLMQASKKQFCSQKKVLALFFKVLPEQERARPSQI